MRSRRLLAIASAALCVVACSRQRGPIQIGLAGPLSEPRGVAMQLGAQLAVNEINARGGVRGRLLQLRALDDSASDDRALRVAQQLYYDRAVVAVVGHLTASTSMAAGDIYRAGARPLTMITPGTASPDLTGVNPYAFSVYPSDSAHGAALARFAWQTLVARRAGVLFVASDYGRGLREAFVTEYTRLGGVIVETDPYLPTTTSVEPYISRMRRAGIDVLMVAAEPQAGEFALRQLDANDARWPLLAGEELAGVEETRARLAGIRIATAYLSDRPGERNTGFVADFGRVSAGARPDYRAAGAYDAVYLLAQAMAAVGPGRTAIRDYLARVGADIAPFEGVAGRIGFDQSGNVISRAVAVGVVRDGHLVSEASP